MSILEHVVGSYRIIPLLSIGANVLPGEPLTMRISAEPYCRLLEHCVSGDETGEVIPFGVSFQHGKIIEPVGCLAGLRAIIQRSGEQKLVALSWGLERYRILEILRCRDFPRAHVEVLSDLSEEIPASLCSEVQRRFFDLKKIQEQQLELVAKVRPSSMLGVVAEASVTNDPSSISDKLSYRLAAELNLEQAERQYMLNEASELHRLEKLKQICEFHLAAHRYSTAPLVQGFIH